MGGWDLKGVIREGVPEQVTCEPGPELVEGAGGGGGGGGGARKCKGPEEGEPGEIQGQQGQYGQRPAERGGQDREEKGKAGH